MRANETEGEKRETNRYHASGVSKRILWKTDTIFVARPVATRLPCDATATASESCMSASEDTAETSSKRGAKVEGQQG